MRLVEGPLVYTEILMSLYYRSESKTSTSSSSLLLYISPLLILLLILNSKFFTTNLPNKSIQHSGAVAIGS